MLIDFSKDSIKAIIRQLKKSEDADKEYIAAAVDFLTEWDNANPYFKVMSSGTTGSPKEMFFNRESLERSARITIDTFSLTEDSVLLHALPLNFIAGKMMLVRAIVAKLKLYIVNPSLNPLEDLDREIDFAAFTPHQIQYILSESPEKLSLIKLIILGGSKVDYSLEKKLQVLDNKVYETFGMSETLTHFAIRKLDKEEGDLSFTVLDGFEWGRNEEDCLWVSATHLPESPIQTSDLIEKLDHSHFIWLGRKDNMINSGGVKVYPEIIERKLLPFISIPFIISKKRDEILGEKVVLFIEEKNKSKLNFSHIDFSVLTKYERPKDISYVSEFPVNKNGKINRSLLND